VLEVGATRVGAQLLSRSFPAPSEEISFMNARKTIRLFSAALLAVTAFKSESVANAQVEDPKPEIEQTRPAEARPERARPEEHLAAGVRLGFMPPVFTVAELLVRPTPHFALGIFGVPLHERYTVGGELMLEMAEPGYSTVYVQGAYLYYADTSASAERSQVLYFTAGYLWKFDVGLELQLGAGALIVVTDETGSCASDCSELDDPMLLPTIDLALRYRFL